MSYASTTDVQARLTQYRQGFGASTRPTADQVAAFLEDTADELDATLAAADYSVPIGSAATHSLHLVRSWNALGAAYRTAMAAPAGHDSKHAQEYGEEWRALLKGIEDGEKTLPDASSGSTANPAFPAAGEGASPYFTRDSLGTDR